MSGESQLFGGRLCHLSAQCSPGLDFKIRELGAAPEQSGTIMEPGDRLIEIDGQSLVDVTHGEAVQMFVKAKEEGRGSVQLKFVKGALDKLKHARRKSVQVQIHNQLQDQINF